MRFTCARNRSANSFPPLDFLLSIVVSIMMKRKRQKKSRVASQGGHRAAPTADPPPCVPLPSPNLRAVGLIHPRSQFVNQATGSSITCLGSYFWYEAELGVQPSSLGLRASLTLSDMQPDLPKQRADQAFSVTVHGDCRTMTFKKHFKHERHSLSYTVFSFSSSSPSSSMGI